MIVVSDTSCVSNLLSIGRASLLPELFGEVFIPPAVREELLRFHKELPGFLKCIAPKDRNKVMRLNQEVDAGEAEAICLAYELNADRLLIDDRMGRAVAVREGLAIIGLVGVLVAAKRGGLVTALRPLLEQLENQAGFRLSQSLKIESLRAVGEELP